MIHRNTYLTQLNAGISTLFARTNVATFVGQDLETPEHFYVQDRDPSEWPNWDDGNPNWDREYEFMTYQGDGTVIASSAMLPFPAYVQEFSGVSHGDLAGDNGVINAIFAFLGISVASPPVDQFHQEVLVLALNGSADAMITDPLGRTLGPNTRSSTDPIPGAEYITVSGNNFKLLLIPDPVEGQFDVDVLGTGSGVYDLGLLNTFDVSATTVASYSDLWDTTQSQVEPGVTVSFALTYTIATSPTISLIAETPLIEVPVWVGDNLVQGRTIPGNTVEIRDASTNAVLGIGMTAMNGHFTISLSVPLTFNQRIYPWSNGVAGVPVYVQAHMNYLPALLRP